MLVALLSFQKTLVMNTFLCLFQLPGTACTPQLTVASSISEPALSGHVAVPVTLLPSSQLTCQGGARL